MDDNEIVYADSSDDELIEENNVCSTCFGDDGLENGEVWIGCVKCTRWDHRACISEEVENMSEREIGEYNFLCIKCEIMSRKIKNAKKDPSRYMKTHLYCKVIRY
jgi:hypothetical protein